MNMEPFRMLIIVLLLLHVFPFFIFHVVVNGYHYNVEEERRFISRWSIIINIFLNLIAFLMVMMIIYNENPFVKMMQLVSMQCTYQDIARLAFSDFACVILSYVFAIGSGAIYFGSLGHLSLRKWNKGAALLLCSISIIPLFMGYKFAMDGYSALRIVEVCRKKTMLMEDPVTHDMEEQDIGYIVIKNTGILPLEIEEIVFSESDDLDNYYSEQLVYLENGQTYRVLLTKATNFSIKKDQSTLLYLSDGSGNTIDKLQVPKLKKNEIYRQADDTWEKVSIDENKDVRELDSPVFSADSGFYSDAFSLTLTSKDGEEIYYTVDGSLPDTDAFHYEKPIEIYDRSTEKNQYRNIQNVVEDYMNTEKLGEESVDKCFVVRAIAVDQLGNRSQVVTRSYFVNQDKYATSNIISLVCDPQDLFGPNGIYVVGEEYDKWYQNQYETSDENSAINFARAPQKNYMQSGKDWERQANVELLTDGKTMMNQEIGIRIQGGSHRTVALKRFTLNARKRYSGARWFDYPIWAPYQTRSAILREGSENAITPLLMIGRDVAVQESIPVSVFINGEYWYDTFLQEKYNEAYFAQHYGVSENNVAYVKGSELDNSTHNSFSSLMKKILYSDFSKQENYDMINELMDMQSYIEYMCANIYLANMDEDEDKNIIIWHTDLKENDAYGDGRWRWALYDMDLLHNTLNNVIEGGMANQDSFSYKGRYVDTSYNQQSIYVAFKNNPTFCKQFVLTFLDLINDNFSVNKVESLLKEWGEDLSYDSYFFRDRPKYIRPYLAQEFDLKGKEETVAITSSQTEKEIQLNSINLQLKENEEWSGIYFRDYPVTVSTDDNSFSHWEITSRGKTIKKTEKTIEVPVEKGGVQIRAIFK